MIIDTTNNYNSPVRLIGARVELYEGSALADTYNQYYGLKELTIERVGESKFFGFGICQKLNVHLIDKDRYMYITTADSFKVSLSTGGDYVSSFPEFYVSEVHRDENTNELSVTAYDAIYKAAQYSVSDLGEIPLPYTIGEFAGYCAELLGVGLSLPLEAVCFGIECNETGANFEGSETIREALNAIAEATQTIYYIDSTNTLVFKRLDLSGNPVLDIDKSMYITLENRDNRRLATIAHITDLGDNVSVSTSATGSTQYVRNNPFWDLREDIDTLLADALAVVGGLTINQFSCKWRGNPLLEIGDKISLTTKDNDKVFSYLLNDTVFYDGSLSQDTEWEYADNEEETESNPASLGDALKQTFARVDKANRQIDIVASEVSNNSEEISSLQLTTENIALSVKSVQDTTEEALTNVNEGLATLSSQVEAKMSSEDVTIAIRAEMANGVSKVVTETGFTFNDEGLTVSKSDSEMKTTITDDGMTVYKNEDAVLIADNVGVQAVNLHANTYLIIGNNSRFEDYKESRTGCFWIGG